MGQSDTLEVQNVNVPGHLKRVNAAKYHHMRAALMKVIPAVAPGITHKEMRVLSAPHLSEQLFPGGEAVGWWSKTVQLDLEAKNLLVRSPTKPLRWYQAS